MVVMKSSVGVVGEDSDRASGEGRLSVAPENDAERQAEWAPEVVAGVATESEGRTATSLLG